MAVINTIKYNTLWGGLPVFIIPALASVYFAVIMPVSYDEAWTFVHFTHEGFTTSVTHYPAPNNHILHSVITNVTKYIPLLSDLLKLRISSIIANVIGMAVLYRFISKHFNQNMALAVVALSSMIFMNVYYSYMSRGYGLYNLFFIAALFMAFNIARNISTRKSWFFFSMYCILGFYAIPTFVYAFVMLHAFLLFSLKKMTRPQLISGAVVCAVVLLLYTPIILTDGIQALTHISIERKMTFFNAAKAIPGYYLIILREMTSFHWLVMLLPLITSIILLIKRRQKRDVYFSLLFLVMPALLLPLHHVIPFVRVFNYYSALFVIIILLPYKDQIAGMRKWILITALLAAQIILLVHFNNQVYRYEERDLAVNITADKIIPDIIGNRRYFFDGVLLRTNLEFHLITGGYQRYTIFDRHAFLASADTLQAYDFAFIRKDMDKTVKTPLYGKTAYYNIYKLSRNEEH
ncbi:MAG: hypothetical protein CFE23_10580 [Flavobacterium sp. BFFFF1]|uniref:hypothetical protein n=1 Tax=Flavobacterium sp. BFFFF1 TaxID=2015557 RepID=UPI000BC83AB4|nr:hypothetical protein [Flavobacterium sp. BFFFF1]OYU80158.1 MAG: hypothetical protein CFE23_10580 [Flavobacterium sp. BFFFF1]